MIGITSFGAYLPRMRLQRQVVAEANAWFDSGLKGLAKGERTMCNWDEDTITMAVEACQDSLGDRDREAIQALFMASTSMPFLDRQNSVLVAEALNLNSSVRTMDVTASQRAGTSALLAARDAVMAGNKQVLMVASEHRRTKCASRQEMLYGDGAAAITLGSEGVIAELVAAQSLADDFVDHYRSDGSDFDYDWEERWIRDEGFLKIVPRVVNALLQDAGISPKDIQHLVLPCEQKRTPATVAKALGIAPDLLADSLIENCGVTGTAHAILQLAHTLQKAKPGELILVIGFGQGSDALLFRVTDAIEKGQPALGVSGNLERRRAETNYNKFQSFNELLEKEMGKRSEIDKQTFLSAMYRNRDLLTRFMGGKCSECGTVQMPKMNYCVNPECGALDTQQNHPMSTVKGTVQTWTADQLTFDFNPPAYFGMVVFEGGGRLMMDFSEVDSESFDTGASVSVHFRIKQIDGQRGFRRYFWKAIQV